MVRGSKTCKLQFSGHDYALFFGRLSGARNNGTDSSSLTADAVTAEAGGF